MRDCKLNVYGVQKLNWYANRYQPTQISVKADFKDSNIKCIPLINIYLIERGHV